MTKTPKRIARVTVRGFKSIGCEQTVEVRPMTVLAGANSSGKSSIMQPLLLLKQTLESSGDPGALRLDGDNVRFTRADQVLNKGAGGQFAVQLALADGQSLGLVFQKDRPGAERPRVGRNAAGNELKERGTSNRLGTRRPAARSRARVAGIGNGGM